MAAGLGEIQQAASGVRMLSKAETQAMRGRMVKLAMGFKNDELKESALEMSQCEQLGYRCR